MTSSAESYSKLIVGCFNAQSMCNKVCGVVELLIDRQVDVCCVTETWFGAKEDARFAEIHEMGFDVINVPRKGRGGGVAFVFNMEKVKPVGNKVTGFKSFEVAECVIKCTNDIIRLCTIYRTTQVKSKLKYSETKVNVFLEDFECYLDSLVNKSGYPILCGDFNFHVENNDDFYSQKFISLYKSKGFSQHVNDPTHYSGSTLDLVLTLNSAIDSVPVNNLTVDSNTGTSSDHYLVKFELPVQVQANKIESNFLVKEVREFSKMDISNFREDLFFSPVNNSNFTSVDQAVEMYLDTIQNILDKHAPLIARRFNLKRSPWWDDKCQEARTNARKAQRKYTKDPNNEEFRELYNEKCIDKAILIDKARNAYYDEKFSSARGDSKETYRLINRLLDREFGANKLPNEKDDDTIAKNFCSFFDTKVKAIYSKIEKSNVTKPETNSQASSETIADVNNLSLFQEVSIDELMELVNNLPDKSCPLDVIPIWLFKKCLPELIHIIHYIVNESLKTGKFPSSFKTAVVRPSLKKPNLDADVLGNYRPISNLPYVSKLLEKVVHKQIVNHIENEGLFADYQSGYRRYHSCETAVLKIKSDLLMLMDKKENTVLLLLDLSAAFDTINHSLLLKKLKHCYNITGIVLNWIKSYLSERKFRVLVNGSSSPECSLEIGVPQGSILGPLLFILYTKDLEKIVTKYGLSVHLYADDTQVYFSFDVHTPCPDLSKIKQCFTEIKLWMTSNYLMLNDDKTEFIDIGYYVSPIQILDLGDAANNLSVSPVLAARNLGFHFDHRLSMDDQISHVSQICYLNLRNIRRIGSRLTHDLKVQLVHANILSIIDYCNSAYAGVTEKNLQKLQKIENNAVRFIFKLNGQKKWTSISPYLKRLHFLPVLYRIQFKVALLVFKCINNLAPKYLMDFISLRDPKKMSMRLDNDFFLLKIPVPPNFTRTEGSFHYNGPKIWNSLPYGIRSLADVEKFKKCLKTFYFDKAFPAIN